MHTLYVLSGFFTNTYGEAYGTSERSITSIANMSSVSLSMSFFTAQIIASATLSPTE